MKSKIKTALLSYGLSGKVFHAPYLELHDGFELVGSWERSKKLIQLDYVNVKSFNSLEEILESKDIELVIVNTPIDTHYEYTKKVLESGKHVLVEKAFTSNSKEAEDLYALAKQLGLKLSVYQNRRWDSDFQTVAKVISDKLLGDLVEVEFRFDRFNPNLSIKSHKESINSGSGILKDLGPHIIDQAILLFGLPESVFCDLRITRKNSQIEDAFQIILYYPHQFRVKLNAGFFYKEQVPSYQIYGSKGSFLKPRGDIQEDELKKGKKPTIQGFQEPIELQGHIHTTLDDGKELKTKIETLSGNYYILFDKLYESIRNNQIEPVTGQEGISVMKVIDASLKSNELKQVVKITP